jgi:hypothetical protein
LTAGFDEGVRRDRRAGAEEKSTALARAGRLFEALVLVDLPPELRF